MVSLFLFFFVWAAIGFGLAPFISPYASIPLGFLCGLYVSLKGEN